MLKKILFPFCCFCLLLLTQCTKKKSESQVNQVSSFHLQDIRLGDGVPLQLSLSLRWKINNGRSFFKQFETTESFGMTVLQPRTTEFVRNLSNHYESVDSLFSSERETYINDVKSTLNEALDNEEITVEEVIVSNIIFPKTYTEAMEQKGLQQQKLERIRQQKVVDIAKAEANKQKVEATSKVSIAEAEAEARIQQIKAKTEKDRRQNELAKAETEAQIAKKQAQAEAERKKLLAKADLEKAKDLKDLGVQKERDLVKVNIEKKRMEAQLDREIEIEMAEMYQNNPTYASFIVNKELASKVEIAVLPSNTDAGVFGNFLKKTIEEKKD